MNKQFRILIVDDDPKLRKTLADILAAKGYSAVGAPTGRAALQSVAEQCFAVALIDLRLEDMSGLQVMKEIKDVSPTTECIVITGHASQASAIEAINVGAYSYLLKPYDIDQLLVTIRRAVEKREAVEALRESEEKFRLIFENAKDAIFWADPETGLITNCNKAAEILLEKTRQDIIGQHHLSLHPPDKGEYYTRMFKTHIENEGALDDEAEVITQSGKIKPVHITASVTQVGGKSVVQGIFRDITDRKRAEERLKDSEALYVSLVENLPQYIFRKDLEGRFTFGNKRFCETLNRPLAEIVGKTDFDFYPRELAEKYRRDDQRVLETRQLWETVEEHQPPGGERIYVQVVKTPLYDSAGTIIGTQGIFWDITEKQKAEERLRESQALLQKAQEVARLGSWNLNLAKNEVSWSDQVYRIFGISKEEFDGTRESFYALVHPEDRRLVQEASERALASGTAYKIDHRIVRPDGAVIWVNEQAEVTRDAEGRVAGMTGTIQDITERKQAEEERAKLEEQLRQAQKMEAVGQLAGGIAHDFNNLLTIIVGNVMLAETTAPEGVRRFLSAVKKASDRAAELIQQLLAFSRKSRTELEPTDVNELVREVSRLARETIDRRIEIDVETRASEPIVLGDLAQIQSVLMNLCVNARDAINDVMEGRRAPSRRGDRFVITLETATVEIDAYYCQSHGYTRPGRFVVISVSDNGCGMNAETQRRIFEPFFTTKQVGSGTGLGLASAYGIVNQHQGWIHVYSEEGKGTTFKIYLPVAEEAIERAKKDEVERMPGGTETILLVDDEEMIRNLGREILQGCGYTVLIADDGKEALNLYMKERDRIDLILLDLSMPHLSGREVLHHLHAISARAKVIVSSGYSESGQAESLEDLGVAGYVPKPYRPLDLARTVRRVLDTVDSRHVLSFTQKSHRDV